MDNKALHFLKEFHNRFETKSFVEIDVYAFLIFSREHLTKDSILREICHFIAHRERNKGETFKFVERIYEIGLSGSKNSSNKLLFDIITIRNELNDFFSEMSLSNIDTNVVVEIALCIMCILQGVPLIKDTTPIGRLEMSLYSDRTVLYANININNHLDIADKTEWVSFCVPVMQIAMKNDIPEEAACITAGEASTFYIKRADKKIQLSSFLLQEDNHND